MLKKHPQLVMGNRFEITFEAKTEREADILLKKAVDVREGGNEHENGEDEWESLIFPNGNSKKELLSFNLKVNNRKNVDGLSNASTSRKAQEVAPLPETSAMTQPAEIQPTDVPVNAMSSSSTSRISGGSSFSECSERNYRDHDCEIEHKHHGREHEEEDDDDYRVGELVSRKVGA